MNPQRDYEVPDKETVRATIQLFIDHGDLFKYPIDGGVSDDEELRAYVIKNDHQDTEDGKSTLCITGINQTENVNKISTILKDMGLEIVNEKQEEDYHESIGDYVSNTLVAFAPKDIESEWNVPRLLIYGSLSPEIEEACYDAFGHKYEYNSIRNHYVVSGEGLTEQDKYKLSDAISSGHGFEDDKRFNKSQVQQSDFV